MATRRAEADRARAQVGIVDAQLQDAVVVAPVNGVVLVKSSELGEVVGAGTTLATIGEMDRPWVRGYVAEKDLGRVRLGMKASVKTDSFPNKEYWGRVSFIASEAEFTPKQIQTQEERVKLVYRIKIEIENPQHELKLNMPVDAEILLNGNK
jgi:HlyD family secretion protein